MDRRVYIVSEDEFSGQVAIVTEVRHVMVDTYVPTQADLEANMYLYRELPKRMEEKTQYVIKIFYHYELGENAYVPDGEGTTNLLECWTTFNADEAKELYEAALIFCK